jgi:hypothetical protein
MSALSVPFSWYMISEDAEISKELIVAWLAVVARPF